MTPEEYARRGYPAVSELTQDVAEQEILLDKLRPWEVLAEDGRVVCRQPTEASAREIATDWGAIDDYGPLTVRRVGAPGYVETENWRLARWYWGANRVRRDGRGNPELSPRAWMGRAGKGETNQ